MSRTFVVCAVFLNAFLSFDLCRSYLIVIGILRLVKFTIREEEYLDPFQLL